MSKNPREVLEDLAPRFSGLEWALSGSLALQLHSLPLEARDLDIQTDARGAKQISEILARYKIREIPFDPQAPHVRSRWMQFDLEGVSVDVMGDLEYRQPDDSWQPASDFKPHIRWLEAGNLKVPVLSLGYLLEFYIQLRRIERVRLIRSHLLL